MKPSERARALYELRLLERRRRQLARALGALESALRVLEQHEAFAAPKQVKLRTQRGRRLAN